MHMLSHTRSAATEPLPETSYATAAPRRQGKNGHFRSAESSQKEESPLSSVRVNWQLKAILPIGLVLLAGLLLFALATVSLRDPQRHAVMLVAGVGAVAICAVAMLALA